MDKFDWHKDLITKETLIDSAYKNSQNSRRFFKSVCGDEFKFNRDFMRWLKENQGKTMGDAANEWMNKYKV